MAVITRTLCFASLAAAVPAPFKCPDWVLPSPWGVQKGTLDANNVCLYSNIRYASPPVNELRFQAPEYPPKSNPALPGPDPSCYQANDVKCAPGLPFEDIPGDVPGCFPKYHGTQSEDCLFLDVYVPKEVFEKDQLAPVVLWLYGGAYLFGSKIQYKTSELPFYDGSGPLGTAKRVNQEKASAIFIRGNYRLGAFGWLAGAYMEKHGQPNAGLLDQRAMLQFVRDHIKGVKGNRGAVSIWGESAGASSIMHHLVMPQNIKEPLFQKAILQSPAFQWLWARSGDLNTTFTQFAETTAKAAKCKIADMACLQTADTKVLQKMNQKIFQRKACDGIIPVGPAVDGKLIMTLAPIGLKAGNMMPLESIIVSHVELEVPYSSAVNESTFIPLGVRLEPKSEASFDKFLKDVFVGNPYANVREDIKKAYPTAAFSDQIARTAAIITDSSFTCNTRFLIDGYIAKKSKVYAMNYGLYPKLNASTHASDLLALFASAGEPQTDYRPLIRCIRNATDQYEFIEPDLFAGYVRDVTAPTLQQFFMDHAIWGKPDYNRGVTEWLLASNDKMCPNKKLGTCVGNLFTIKGAVREGDSNDGVDTQTPSTVCDFWHKLAQEIARLSVQDVRAGSGAPEQSVLSEEL